MSQFETDGSLPTSAPHKTFLDGDQIVLRKNNFTDVPTVEFSVDHQVGVTFTDAEFVDMETLRCQKLKLRGSDENMMTFGPNTINFQGNALTGIATGAFTAVSITSSTVYSSLYVELHRIWTLLGGEALSADLKNDATGTTGSNGHVALTNAEISTSTIEGSTIGATTPATGVFTTAKVETTAEITNLNLTETLSIAGSQGTAGQVLTTDGTGTGNISFASIPLADTIQDGNSNITVNNNSDVTFTGDGTLFQQWDASANKVLFPTAVEHSGAVTIASGSVNATTIGATTPAAGTFTTLGASEFTAGAFKLPAMSQVVSYPWVNTIQAYNGTSYVTPLQFRTPSSGGVTTVEMPTSLSVTGSVTAGSVNTGAVNSSSISSSGDISTNGQVNSSSGVFTAGVSAASLSASGAVSGASVTAAGAVTAASATVAGAVQAANVSATSTVFTDSIQANGSFVGISASSAVPAVRITNDTLLVNRASILNAGVNLSVEGDVEMQSSNMLLYLRATGSQFPSTISSQGTYSGNQCEPIHEIAEFADHSSYRAEGGYRITKYVSALTSQSGYTFSAGRHEMAGVSYDGSWKNRGIWPLVDGAYDLGVSSYRYQGEFLTTVYASVPASYERSNKIRKQQMCI